MTVDLDALPITADPSELLAAADLEPAVVLARWLSQLPAWRSHAACVDTGPELFFPSRGQSIEPAVRICRSCPVRAECLADAMADPEWRDLGVRGGLSVRRRQMIRDAHRTSTGGEHP